jgi:formylmethanofuran dehydrogenase subunit E
VDGAKLKGLDKCTSLILFMIVLDYGLFLYSFAAAQGLHAHRVRFTAIRDEQSEQYARLDAHDRSELEFRRKYPKDGKQVLTFLETN